MSDHARRMDADAYWRQFPTDWRPTEPGEVLIGTVDHLGQAKVVDGWAPKLRIKTDDGFTVNVIASQAQLLASMIALQPAEGDRIKIVYEGTVDTGVPGLRPAHRYVVRVQRRNEEPAGAP